MRYFKVVVVGLLLFTFTCGLCWIAGALLQFSPLYSVIFFLIGTLGVVLTIDVLQELLFG